MSKNKTKAEIQLELAQAEKRIAELEASAAVEGEERFASIFRASPAQMALTDVSTGRYVEVNEAFLHTLGFAREDVVGRTALELNLFENPAQRAELLQRMVKQGHLRNEYVLVRAKSGEVRHGIFSAEYVHANGQELLLTVMNDITEKMRAEQRWLFALEGAGDGVWDWDAQTNRVFFSPRWKAMLGYEEHEIGDTLEEWVSRVHPDDLAATMDKVNAHLEGRMPTYISEHRVRRKDGTYQWILDRGRVVEWSADHKPLRVIGTHKDISESKAAQERLGASEEHYRALVESLNVSLCRWRPDTTLTYANEKYKQIFGLQGDAVGRKWLDFLPEETRASTAAFYENVTKNPRTVTYEHPVTVEDGSLRHYQWTDTPILDERGEVVEFQSVGVDVTERKNAEGALRESEARLKGFLDAAPDAMVIANTEGRIIVVNAQAESMFGYPQSELIGASVEMLMPAYLHAPHVENRSKFMEQPHAMTAGSTNDMLALRKDGTEFPIEISLSHHKMVTGEAVVLCAIRNVTERKLAEFALIASEKKLQSLVDSQSHFVIRVNMQGKYSYWNKQFEKEFGWLHPQGMQNSYPLSAIHEHHHQRVNEVVNKCIAEPDRVFSVELDKPAQDGGVRNTLWEFMCLTDEHNQPSEIQCMGIEITARKQAEQALAVSEELYRLTLSNISDAVFVTDPDGKFTFVCPNVHILFGHNQSEVEEMGHIDRLLGRQIFNPADLERLGEIPNIGHTVVDKFGRAHDLLVTVKQISLRGGTVLYTCHDVTNLKQAEEARRESEERFRSLFENSGVTMLMIEPDSGQIVDANLAAAAFYGYTHDQLVDMNISQINQLPPEQVAAERQKAKQEQGNYFIFPHRLADGRTRTVEVHSHPFNVQGKTLLYSIILDITQREQAERELKKSQELLKEAQRIGRIGYMEWNRQEQELACSDEIYEIFDVPPHTPISKNLIDSLMKPGERDHLRSLDAQALQQRMDMNYEYSIRTRDGSERWLHHMGKVTYGEDGAPIRMMITVQDVTERKKTEAALRASEEKYRGLMGSLDTAISILDYEGRFLYMNDMGAEKLGGKPQDFIGRNMTEIFPEPFARQQLNGIHFIFDTDQRMAFEAPGFGDNGLRWYRFTLQPIHDENDRVIQVLVNATDIHTLKTAQQELQELNRTLEERVRERTAQVHDLYDNAPVGYHALDAQARFIAINQTELDWLGYEREELLGRPITTIFTPPMAKNFLENFAQFKIDGKTNDQEFEALRKNGATFPVAINAAAIYDENGQYVSSRSTMTDITLRKQAENALQEREKHSQSLLRLSRKLEQAQTYSAILDAARDEVQSAIGYQNLWVYLLSDDQKTAKLLTGGGPMEEILKGISTLPIQGDPMMEEIIATRDIVVIEDARTDERTNKAIVDMLGNRTIVNVPIVLFDRHLGSVGVGTFGDEGLRIPSASDREYLTTLASHMAVTFDRVHLQEERKRAENTLRLTNDELERAMHLKDEFLATMSHELRTPLNAILGLSQSMIEQFIGPLNERQLYSLQTIESSGRHLLELINDILDLSKFEANQMTLDISTVSVPETCQASLLLTRDAAYQKHILVTSKLDPLVKHMQADGRRLKQMLINLLGNAIKFTPEGGTVELQVTGNLQEETVSFSIIDTGIGIAEADLPRLFQPFVQLDGGLDRQYEGTGLGLSLVARMAKLHGGNVSVESQLQQGSRFTITLPWKDTTRLNPFEAGASAPSNAPAASHTGGRTPLILVVEDNEANIVTLTMYLQATGYRVAIARNGLEALDQVARKRPNLILMDLQMPVLDGLEATRRLRSDPNPQVANIPVIAITALAMPTDHEQALAAGANDYLSKPVDLKQLAGVINRLVRES